MAEFIFYDGKNCLGKPAKLTISSQSFRIENLDGKVMGVWPFDDVLTPTPLPRDYDQEPLVLRCDDFKERFLNQRLVSFDGQASRQIIRAIRPNLRKIKNRGRKKFVFGTLLVWLLLAGVAVGVPYLAEKAAPLISPDIERVIGESSLTQFEFLATMFQRDPVWINLDKEGQLILDSLVDRLWSTQILQEATDHGPAPAIHILNTNLVNAFTIPGNQIILTSGFLRQMDGLDELAGIMAHEMSHVGAKHVMQQLIKSTSFQYVAEILAGGASYLTSTAVQGVITMRWSRDTEHEADLLALEILKQAKISPEGLAGFFDKISDDKLFDYQVFDIDLNELLSSHPESRERAALFASQDQYPVSPILGEDNWRSTGLRPRSDRQKNNLSNNITIWEIER